MPSPKLIWDIGTGYDMFMSLHVIYVPEKSGVRGKWAAGVRSRLPADAREILQQAQGFLGKMLHWLYFLAPPKDGTTVLQALAEIPPPKRIPTLLYFPGFPVGLQDILESVAARQSWDRSDQQALRPFFGLLGHTLSKETQIHLLEWSAHQVEYGERYLQALQMFYEVFFAEEERRIQPALEEALERAQGLAKQLELTELLEELSQGVRYTEDFDLPELVLAPSFWSTPLVAEGRVSETRQMILFGARPANASLVPGEVVPDSLSWALKALADPTRLRILRYLAAEPLAPAQLARRLRLRAPTVIHHLHTLRLAGLVYVILEAGDQRRYTARFETVETTFNTLKHFLGLDGAQMQ